MTKYQEKVKEQSSRNMHLIDGLLLSLQAGEEPACVQPGTCHGNKMKSNARKNRLDMPSQSRLSGHLSSRDHLVVFVLKKANLKR